MHAIRRNVTLRSPVHSMQVYSAVEGFFDIILLAETPDNCREIIEKVEEFRNWKERKGKSGKTFDGREMDTSFDSSEVKGDASGIVPELFLLPGSMVMGFLYMNRGSGNYNL